MISGSNIILKIVGLVLFVLFAQAFGGTDVIAEVLYGHDPQEAADVYQAPGSSNPAVVVIHGGGFVGGDKARARYVWTCRDFVRHGITCFSIDYRLLKIRDKTTLGYAQLVEAQLAMRWVRANAAKYGVDPARVCAWGDSAGAYYAVMLGVTETTYQGNAVDDSFGESRTLPKYSSHADCVVAMGVPADLGSLTNPVVVRLVSNLVSILPLYAVNAHAALEAVSPLERVNAHSAPMYIIQGDQDPLFAAGTQAEALVKALKANGVPARYVLYHGGHVFCADASVPCNGLMPGRQVKEILDEAARWVASTMKAAGGSRSDQP